MREACLRCDTRAYAPCWSPASGTHYLHPICASLWVQVGIVLYRTLATFLHKRVTGGSVAYGFVSFIAIFLGSVLIGELSDHLLPGGAQN